MVDTEAEFLAQMNASNGALAASIACADVAGELAEHLQSFKIGITKLRSRGPRPSPSAACPSSCGPSPGAPGNRLSGNVPGDIRYPETS